MKDNRVLITGGATHIGKAIALRLAARGAIVNLASRNLQRSEKVATEIVTLGGRARAHRCDVTDRELVFETVENIVERDGRLDAAICNAGGSFGAGPFLQVEEDAFIDAFRLNVLGAINVCQAAGQRMAASGGGSIVLIGSIHGFLGRDRRVYLPTFPGSSAAYYVAKGAIINLMRVMASELGEYGIRVNCVSPGQILKDTIPDEQAELFRSATPLGRTGTPDDVAAVVEMLTGDTGSFITGQNYVVDGGWSVW